MGAVVIVAGLITLAAFLYGWSPLWRWRLRRIPGYTGYWMIGNMADVVKRGQHVVQTEGNKKFGPVFKMWFGRQPIVVVGDGPAGKALALRARRRHPLVMAMEFFHGAELEAFRSEILVVQDEAYHASLKAAWPPAFRAFKMDEYVNKMNRSVGEALGFVEAAAAQGKELELVSFFGRIAMDVVGSTAFGFDLDMFKEAGKGSEETLGTKLVNAFRINFDLVGLGRSTYAVVAGLFSSPVTIPLLRMCSRVYPGSVITTLIEKRSMVRELLKPLLDAAKIRTGVHVEAGTEMKGSAINGGAISLSASAGLPGEVDSGLMVGGGFIGAVAEATHRSTGKPFTDYEILSQALSFLGGGFETTTMHLSITFWLLARNPDKLAKLQQEVDGIRAGDLALADLEGLPYLSGCLKESLRLFPVSHVLLREATQNIDVCGYDIPKGTWLHVNLTWVGRNPEYWREPDAFIPERWVEGTPESAQTPDNCHYNFGDGSLQCVGMRFAVLEAKLTVARFVQRFEFELSPGQEEMHCTSAFNLKPRDGVHAVPKLRLK